MKDFLTEIEQVYGFTIVNLIDQKNSVRVKIVPELGNNLMSLTISKNGEKNELIYIPDVLQNLTSKDYKFYGNPILFPFPGRIPKGKFTFQQREFQLPINFEDDTAIHGFVYNKKWEIVETSPPSDKEAVLKSAYQTDAAIEEFFPFPFRVEMSYVLRANELVMIFEATNLGKEDFPFGYGVHPYFLLPGKREDWLLYFPASKIYELVNILPTGKVKDIPLEFDFREEKSLAGVFMDDLFGEIQKDNSGSISCWIRNRVSKFKLTVTSDENFEYYILYAPPEHNFICIEPYTCVANAVNLANSGVKTGLRTLSPDETFRAKISFTWEF